MKGVHISELGTGRFLFRFFHEGDIAGVLADGLWTFDQNLVVMRRLEQGDDPAMVELDVSSFWIQVHNLPSGLYSCLIGWLKIKNETRYSNLQRIKNCYLEWMKWKD